MFSRFIAFVFLTYCNGVNAEWQHHNDVQKPQLGVHRLGRQEAYGVSNGVVSRKLRRGQQRQHVIRMTRVEKGM